MSVNLSAQWPTWLRDVDALIGVHAHFVLAGNVRDFYRLPLEHLPLADGVAEALGEALAPSGFDVLLTHDLIDGYQVLAEDAEAGWAAVQGVVGQDLRDADAGDLSTLMAVLQALAAPSHRRLALVLERASQLTGRVNDLTSSELQLFRAASKAADEAAQVTDGGDRGAYNPVFWLVERAHDLPEWFSVSSAAVRHIAVPNPGLAARRAVAEELLTWQSAGPAQLAAGADRLAATTDGLGAQALVHICGLLAGRDLEPVEIEDAVRLYKVGAAESPWRTGFVAQQLRGTEQQPAANERLSGRVLGQPRAVTKTVDILIRAVSGLSGAQATSSANRPRGVLFLAGPTGTGKTELVKATTELVFGSPDAHTRFDMSEFSAEHAGDRLIGAPPGYVGFDAGGELTEAVRRSPYRLLLFDEIEKAHPLILDKFLQILEDGRLTDGRGTTVHFSETIIVFTSNLGFYRLSDDGRTRVQNIWPDEHDYEELERRIRDAVDDHFTRQINRPELLNRLGDNVVVFDFIRPDVGADIARLQLSNVLSTVQRTTGAHVALSPSAEEDLVARATRDLTFGGRGIGNVIESALVNPLARALFEQEVKAGDSVSVTRVLDGEHGPAVVLR